MSKSNANNANKAKGVTLYLVPRTREAFRDEHDRSLSGRINQIMDRYLEIKRIDGPVVRDMFPSAAQWAKLVQAYGHVTSRETREPLQAVAIKPSLLRELSSDSELKSDIDELSAGDFFVLIDLLEDEQPPLPPELRTSAKRNRADTEGD